jgi:hypothetical protein
MLLTESPSLPITDGSPEAAVLLWGVWTLFTPTQTQQPPAVLQQPLDWVRLLQLACRHGVLPCLYRLYLVYRTLLPAVLKNRVGRDQRFRSRRAVKT